MVRSFYEVTLFLENGDFYNEQFNASSLERAKEVVNQIVMEHPGTVEWSMVELDSYAT